MTASRNLVLEFIRLTSFYALHELHVFALDNAPDFAEESAFGKAALEKVLRLSIQILTFSDLKSILGSRKSLKAVTR